MKALNRKEAIVNAKANGTLDSFKTLTRDEAFTKKALGLGGGALYVDITYDANNPRESGGQASYTSSKTAAEIIEAVQNGMSVIARHIVESTDSSGKWQTVNYFPLKEIRLREDNTNPVNTYVAFKSLDYEGERLFSTKIIIRASGEVEISNFPIEINSPAG